MISHIASRLISATCTTSLAAVVERNCGRMLPSKSYLIWFAHEHLEFREAELLSLMNMFDIKLEFVDGKPDPGQKIFVATGEPKPPWMIVRTNKEEDLVKICSRSILIRHVAELMAVGSSIEEVIDTLKSNNVQHHTDTFKFEVEAFGRRKIQRAEKIAKMEMFDFLPFDGDIVLMEPQRVYSIMEFYGMDGNSVPEKPYKVFFGRMVSEGRRDLVAHLSLKTRRFIANTSMDATLSIIMSNMAQIQSSDVVYDPFVGSGSLLVAAAFHGGYVFGMDIDYLLLHAKAKPTRSKQKTRQTNESVLENLKQYRLEARYIDVVVGDSSMPVLNGIPVDAIVTDPPYGIRESTERIGTRKSQYTVPGHLAEQHIPSKVSYNLNDVVHDLLTFAAENLPLGRRAVFWLPVYRSDFVDNVESTIPKHPSFQLVAASEQRLASHSSRLLFTYQKVKEPSEEDDLDAYREVPSAHSENFREKYFAKHREKDPNPFTNK